MAEHTTPVNVMTEIEFVSDCDYADPYNEIELDVRFTGPNGREVTIPGFWAGGNVWKVRFAPPEEGEWQYRTVSNRNGDSGLSAVTGTVSANRYEGGNPLLRHGRLRISKNRRYLEHADGTPFLWIGDTWWMGLSRRLDWPDGFQELTADRVDKGFTAIQIITGPYPDMTAWDERGKNEAGLPFEDDFARINPAYYDAVDTKIAHLVGNGLMPCIVGMWGYYLPQIGIDRIKRYWRYIVARYGAYPVCWCAAGEGTMPWYLSENKEAEAAEQKSGWTEVVRYMREVDGWHNPITIHPTQYGRAQVEDPSVLDFEMLQTGHGSHKSLVNNVESVRQAYAEKPTMPTYVSEVNYEAILGRSYADVQRMCYWQAVLSGAFGHTYGANGIWQMSTIEEPYGPSPHGRSWGTHTWREAMHQPGSRQVGLASKLWSDVEWWLLEPHNEWIENAWDGTDYDRNIGAGVPGKLRVFYIPMTWGLPNILAIEPGIEYRAFWFNPLHGDRVQIGPVKPDADGTWTPPHPVVVHDWVLVMRAI